MSDREAMIPKETAYPAPEGSCQCSQLPAVCIEVAQSFY